MMHNILHIQVLRVVGALVTAVLLTGCVNGPGANGTQSSGYKGNAPWNISRAEQAARPAS
jgi:hypothetical protein